MKLTFDTNTDSPADIQRGITLLQTIVGGDAAPAAPAASASTSSATATDSAESAGKGKRGKGKATETPPAATSASKDDVRAALQAVVTAHGDKGMDVGEALLGEFTDADGKPCTAIRSLQESDYAAVVEACKASVATAKSKSRLLED